MINDLTTFVRFAGEAVLPVFIWPGEQMLVYLADVVPGMVETLTLHPANVPLLYAVSLAAWLALFLFVRGIVRIIHNTLRLLERLNRFIRFRMSLAMVFAKRRVDSLSTAFRIWRHPEEAETPHVEFDNRDIAVLDAIIARGPGYAVAAPELAEQLAVRPSQAQRSLETLCENLLLESVIGSTDGFDNYRVTAIGEAFLRSWLRQTSPHALSQPARKEPTPEPAFIPDGLHLRG